MGFFLSGFFIGFVAGTAAMLASLYLAHRLRRRNEYWLQDA